MYEKILMCLGLQGKGEMRTYWLTGEDPSKSRRNSTEAEESAATNLLLRNNNCTECICECESGQRGEPEQNICPNKCLALDVNGVAVGDQPNQLINMRLFKPTTWLLAECNNGKLDHIGGGVNKKTIGIGGRYVSCSNVFQECKASIIKELKKTGTSHPSNRFRSAPIITFIDTSSNPFTGTPGGFPYEEPKFV
ncbi:hypothetical protein Fcan01_09784 [Folsomia candida]|uniref:Uncharacterized protein n=1 Tax=Folsomia candida TaxID=158441 RepID=A0A226EFL5_FOLCA|nr:hypothetical protein Fcan01_09784 [Folsomia candida]